MSLAISGNTIIGIGQDSHAFGTIQGKPLILGGVRIANHTPLAGNSDADVVLHAICNAISSVSGSNIIGAVSDEMCQRGITDSRSYVQAAMNTLTEHSLLHLAISIEAKTPKLAPYLDEMKASIAEMTGLLPKQVGITATSGEALTAFGKGEGIQVFVLVTTQVT